ncbi:beta-galactosidase GalB [Flammeovirgaceae bacterium SG7u.111]|nr:beta-galactosidase GalB [Flammeovirgaceae bacterium SG7u.132]WPO34815.1 beta-galactosidase GalB [Flammeovirgaceae bacterium SG7u.111]
MRTLLLILVIPVLFFSCSGNNENENNPRKVRLLSEDWKFYLGEPEGAEVKSFDDRQWRTLDIPHDWSIEGEFDENHPATVGGGALPGGVGWYRKYFKLSAADSAKLFTVIFDGVYRNSEVWINGHFLGNRPNGYISFQYDLTPHLGFGEEPNVLAVKVNNSPQPNSRWYSGSGIYRNVWLESTEKIYVEKNETFITTPEVSTERAIVNIKAKLRNATKQEGNIKYAIEVKKQASSEGLIYSHELVLGENSTEGVDINIKVPSPALWSVEDPNLYQATISMYAEGELVDKTSNTFGIRYFDFDPEKGFFLNGKPMKIKGVCNHHDLGSLGAAINTRALRRQLEIMQEMGANAIRTTHNPPAPELLDLCDEMGFLVMDEMFDMWKKGKTEFDYSLNWDKWHVKDLQDFIKRDRNHPSIIIWSVGNEIPEQWDEAGKTIATELAAVVRELDTTRAITVACNPPSPENTIAQSGALDLIGYNYALDLYENFPEVFPGKCFIATETTSALATRGYYDMPSDTVQRWPVRWDIPFTQGNPDNTVSAYDHVSTPWGATHEEVLKVIMKHDYLSGMFVWTGFDYLGEPTPYSWPSRSSFFGIVDLAGFPKDTYYLYKSLWAEDPVLHIYPHWNWSEGDSVDIWAYATADEVELFLNGKSLGKKEKEGDELHLMWKVPFEKGTITAKSAVDGKELVKELKTAEKPHKINLEADRGTIQADGVDLSFVTVTVVDSAGTIHPQAHHQVSFELEGPGKIVGVDNGNPNSHESFKGKTIKAFYGKCLVVIQSTGEAGTVKLVANSDGLEDGELVINVK